MSKVEISGCSGDTCTIHKGKPLHFVAEFTANQDSKKAEIKISGMVNGLEIPIPGVETNGCNHVKCPLVKGQKYTLIYDLTVPTILPSIKTVVTAKLIGDHGVLACGSVSGEVKE